MNNSIQYAGLHYKVAGGGDFRIYFIHGNSQSLDFWDRLLENENLLKKYELIALDLPGHGYSFRSFDPAADYSAKGMAAHVAEFIGSFDSKPYILVGHSFGCNVVCEMAAKKPDCAGFVLISPTASGKAVSGREIVRQDPSLKILFQENYSRDQLELFVNDAGNGLDIHGKTILRRGFTATDANFRKVLGEVLHSSKNSDELAALEASGKPVAVVYGADDRVIVPDSITKSGIKMWEGKPHTIAGAGHFPQVENSKAIGELVTSFAAECFAQATARAK